MDDLSGHAYKTRWQMGKKLFGTDGIRGLANEHPLDPETAIRVGKALTYILKNGVSKRPRIAIGRDTRLSGGMLAAAISSGICSAGGDVIDIGIISTPAVAYLTSALDAHAGIVISASHNPYYDNGIKIFSESGYKLSDELEHEIESLVLNGDIESATEANIGVIRYNNGLYKSYMDYLKKSISPPELSGMKIVLDAANGAAYKIATEMLESLGAALIKIGTEPDGININDGVGAVHPEKMSKLTYEAKAAIGIALDGDADRLILSDEQGNIVDGDKIMGFAAKYMLEKGTLRGNGVVATVMSNLGLELALKEMGIELVRVGVGDRFVVEKMREGGYNLGGEQSGHLIFMDHSTTGDGLLSALMVLKIMHDTGKPLSELASVVSTVPQKLVNIPVKEKKPIEELPLVLNAIRHAEERLGDTGRVLVRYSGTENKARIMIEAMDETIVDELTGEIADAFKKSLN